MKNINILLSISALLLSLMLVSCDDDAEPYTDSESVDCEYCFEEKPALVDMELKFNMVLNSESVFFTVYSGYAMASEVYMSGETNENSIWIQVVPDQKYTVVAEYKRGDRYFHVINDCFVKTEYFKSACDSSCYYVYEASCDLSLKSYDF